MDGSSAVDARQMAAVEDDRLLLVHANVAELGLFLSCHLVDQFHVAADLFGQVHLQAVLFRLALDLLVASHAPLHANAAVRAANLVVARMKRDRGELLVAQLAVGVNDLDDFGLIDRLLFDDNDDRWSWSGWWWRALLSFDPFGCYSGLTNCLFDCLSHVFHVEGVVVVLFADHFCPGSCHHFSGGARLNGVAL